MTHIDLQLDGDACWPELEQMQKAGLIQVGELIGVALLPDAEAVDTFTGQAKRVASLTLRIRLPHPTDPQQHHGHVLVQLKVDMLETIARALRGRLQYLEELRAKGGTPS